MAAAGGAAGPIKTTAFFTFGRFQPPTNGHKIMIKNMVSDASIIPGGADIFVFVSPTNDKATESSAKKVPPSWKKANIFLKSLRGDENIEKIASKRNPLTSAQKVKFMKKQYADQPIEIIDCEAEGCPTVPLSFNYLADRMYTNIVMYIGEDRANDFNFLVGTGKRRTPPVNFLTNPVPRPKDAMSATKVRSAAIRGNLGAFSDAVKFGAVTDENVEQLRKNVLAGMWLTPTLDLEPPPAKEAGAAAGAGGGAFAEGGRRKTRRGSRRRARKTRRTSRR